MIPEVIRRLAAAAVMIAALLTAVFALVHLAPGDPVDLIVHPDLDDQGRADMRRAMGLDRSLVEQYRDWATGLLTGDLGRSLHWHRPVSDLLAETLPRTLLLTVSSYVVHMVAAVLLGVLLAVKRRSWWTRLLDAGGLVVHSLPSFWLGLMLILVFARWLGWLPAGGLRDNAATLGGQTGWLDVARHLVLPVAVLGLATSIGTARLLRTGLLEQLGQDYVAAARTRGLPERVVVWRHALRNTLLPMVTLVGLDVPFLLSGSVVVETVFAWPGMGRLAVDAIFARDYPVIMAVTAMSGVLVVLGNLLADVLYRVVDPRVGSGRSDP